MNICFLIGKIASDIEFDFIIKGKNISIARFELKLENKSTIKIKAYNKIADKCYKTLKKGNTVIIQGKINSKMEIEIEQIYSVYEEGIWKKN